MPPGRCGVDLPEPPPFAARLGGLERRWRRSACPVSASRKWCAISPGCRRRIMRSTAGLYPLGSCTMKHNPRLNEKLARLPGLARHSPAAAGLDRARRARADRHPGALAEDLDRHAGGGVVAGCGRAWRIVRHDDDPRRPRSPRRPAPARAGAGIGAWHQPGDGGGMRLCGRSDPGQRARPGRPRGARSESSAPTLRH